jgi:phage gp36-like protein
VAYAVIADLVPLRLTQAELVQLTDDANTGQVNEATVNAALEEASGRVDSYCRSRYVTPLQVGDDVKGMTLDIAVYLLFSRRRNAKLSETVRTRYEDAITFLKDIAAGRASLDQPATQVVPQASNAGPVISDRDYHLRFREHDLKGYV